jgi:hypothetical protein
MEALGVGLAVFAAAAYFWYSKRRSSEVRKSLAAVFLQPSPEELVTEEAPWLGVTGLGSEAEREVARYLRREIGQSVDDPNSVKLNDLEYLGVYLDGPYPAHYWRYSSGGETGYVSLMPAPNGLNWDTTDKPTKPQKAEGSYA